MPITCSARVVPLGRAAGHFLPLRPAVLLLVSECSSQHTLSCTEIHHRYGCTVAEARLAHAVAEGRGLREAAQSMGITYGTARVYLKIVFQKVGVHTQAQLVAKLLADPPARHAAREALN
jgi:DNA-binding CsgD family transcriptional regulator